MWLPGETARGFCTKILTQYFAGDVSLLKEIEANAASNAPISQMARVALASNQSLEHVGKLMKLASGLSCLLEAD